MVRDVEEWLLVGEMGAKADTQTKVMALTMSESFILSLDIFLCDL